MSNKADALLAGLLGALGNGESVIEKKEPKKKKRQLLIGEELQYTWRLHEPSMKTVALVLENHKYVCKCGSTHVAPNLHLLTMKEDKHGNRHLTQFITQSDIDEAPRMETFKVLHVQACTGCIMRTKEIKPVVSDDSKERIDEIQVDDEIAKLLNKWDEEGK